ncbi:single-stranded DNA-binding protein [Acidihalobacter aeolianus]|uniref:Single-stranded DNA-binding protein n=1 Tax=Acidihalobacter aeolianus TaxID=2792603 RepID=A0A1D8K6J7_9GAMM|nr:single-stranded DNA-binding protein [Acidihalobacter aeolianus]AOV16581.1 single-stranded DNA-binding protein [Acidihalobacter aeolianus]
MIDGLIAGKLCGKPQQRTSNAGKSFATCRVRTTTGDGNSVFVNAIAFASDVCASLLALADGDSVSLSGPLTPKAWMDKAGEPRPALDLVAHAVLTPYHVTRKRAAMRKTDQPPGDPNDDLPDF